MAAENLAKFGRTLIDGALGMTKHWPVISVGTSTQRTDCLTLSNGNGFEHASI
jgi:hypothetical protein